VSVVLTENGRIKRFSDYYDFVRFFLGYQMVQAPAAIRSPLTGVVLNFPTDESPVTRAFY
jgi:hypothetical protein